MPRKSTKPPQPKDLPVTSAEEWDLVKYYSQHEAQKVKAAGGDPKQVLLVRFGTMRKVGGGSIARVPAVHSNGLNPVFLDKAHAEALKANGLTAYVGPPGGYGAVGNCPR